MTNPYIPLVASLTFLTLSSFTLPAATGFALKQDAHGIEITHDGKPFASLVIDQANKPYLWPVYGPTGKAMTRAYPMQDVAAEPKAQRDHPHHRGLLFGHESIGLADWSFAKKKEAPDFEGAFFGGGDTWHEKMTFEEMMRNPKQQASAKRRLQMLGGIRHRAFPETRADENAAVIVQECDFVDATDKVFLLEKRRWTFRMVGGMHAIDVDQELIASAGDARIEDRKDAGLSIRVPSSMAVDSKQGGKIENSDGVTDKDAWGKSARWCDYHGPVEGEHLGIAFLNHPSSFRFPTRWHVRTYGLFTANPFASQDYDKTQPDGTTLLKAGEKLTLNHRFLFHKGDASAAKIEEAWQQYAKEKKN